MNMKRNKNLINRLNGFSIVETMVSLSLVTMAILLMARVTAYSIFINRQSALRLEIYQELDSYKEQLMSSSFSDQELESGHSEINAMEGIFKIIKDVEDLSPSLKRITLQIGQRSNIPYSRKVVFYKSKYIKEVSHD